MSSGLQQRSQGKGKAVEEDDALSKLGANASAEPLDDQEQEAVIRSLREANDKSNYIFRALMLVMLGLVGILYLTPIPDYVTGNHPETHLTMFFQATHLGPGTHEDLWKFPALPAYIAFLLIQGTLLYGAAKETAYKMGLITIKGTAFPQQPHMFGTAPSFLVPILSDIRWHPSHMGVRADSPEYRAPPVTATMSPRLLYLCFLTFVSFPLPLLTFGAGSFVNSGWWAITTVALIILCLCERMMDKSERETVGLNGMKYSYKGA